MNVYLAEKLKSLRAEKRVSQEKLAQYLNVSMNSLRAEWRNSGLNLKKVRAAL